MNLCIPVLNDNGSASQLCPHFGSSPLFILVDTESGACRAIPNHQHGHDHGRCAPLAALAGETIDGVIVGGIGMGALTKLGAAGVRVYLSRYATVSEAIAAFKAGSLQLVTPDLACVRHGHGHA